MKNQNIILQKKRNAAGSLYRIVLAVCFALLCAPMMSQQTFTFTNCTAVGRFGPTQAQVTSDYASTSLAGSVVVGAQQGVQQFTIPASGAYMIEAYGAQGYGAGGVGGRGAKMVGEFNFTAGQVLKIIVGQKGELPSNASYNAQFGGGGGSFVTDLSNVPYIVAGGGGANWTTAFSTICDAPISTTGNTGGGVGSTGGVGGSGGAGGIDASSASAGGGLTGNGAGTSGGFAFINGGNGGFTTYAEGGFGGGGGTSSFNNRRCGGGGGYSGGGGAHGGTTGFPEGGGGGSYNSGTNQVNTPGFNLGHGRIVLTKLCNVNIAAINNPVCAGSLVTLTTNALSNIIWSHSASTGTSIALNPTVTTNYSVTGVGTPNSCTTTAVLQVSVMPLPFVSAYSYPLLICPGGSASLTGVGALTYSWSTGPTGSLTTVNPQATSTYTVFGVDANGCENSNTVSVSVSNASLNVSPSSTVCEGTQVTLMASGAMSYTWSNGTALQGIQVTPNSTTTYTVMATDANFCQLTNTVQVTVNQKPNVTATAVPPEVCKGESVVLSAGGASSYTWTGNAPGSSVTVTPLVDIPYSYTVTGAGTNSCTRSFVVTVLVNKCAGISENSVIRLSVYPNPGSGVFMVKSASGAIGSIELHDLSGRLVHSESLNADHAQLDLSNFASGVYYLKVSVNNDVQVIKLINQ